jgi:hypothetical protein
MEYNHQLERIQRITEVEWREALKELSVYIMRRLHGRTKYGAHSQSVLGMDPLDFYTGEAVKALLSGEWKWKDDHPLAEQLQRIAWSKIDKQVKQYELRKGVLSPVDLDSTTDIAAPDEESDILFEKCRRAAEGDLELELYVQAVYDCNSFEEICEDLGIADRQHVYNLQRKLKRRILSLTKK